MEKNKQFVPHGYRDENGDMHIMDLNQWYKHYCENSGFIKAQMIEYMFNKIISEFEYNHRIELYGIEHCEMDLDNINYSHYCYIAGWPDLQDGGIFEDCIETAGEMDIRAYFGFVPRWSKFGRMITKNKENKNE